MKNQKLNRWIYRFLGRRSLRYVSKMNNKHHNHFNDKTSVKEDRVERFYTLKNI